MVELFTRSYLFLLQDIHIMDGSDEEDQMLKVDFIWYPKFLTSFLILWIKTLDTFYLILIGYKHFNQ